MVAIGEKGRTILGDLHEDFLAVVAERGEQKARAWYWRVTVGLCLGRVFRAPNPRRGEMTMMGLMMGLLEDLRGALRAQRRVLGSTALVVVALGVGRGRGLGRLTKGRKAR